MQSTISQMKEVNFPMTGKDSNGKPCYTQKHRARCCGNTRHSDAEAIKNTVVPNYQFRCRHTNQASQCF